MASLQGRASMESRTKGILKKSFQNPSSTTTISSPSWFSRIQSKLYAGSDDSLALHRQELKRVTFSVRNLTTEHILSNGDEVMRQEIRQKMEENCCKELPKYYEKACRLHEVPVMEYFAKLLRANCSSNLTSINLANHSIDARQVGPIADILIMDTELHSLDLSNCNLEDESIRILLHSLLINDEVTELRIGSNPLKSEGIKYIAIYISQSRSIQSIDLSGTTFDKRGMRYLSQALTASASLRQLCLDRCVLKPTLLEILAGGVRQSTCPLHLSLQYNRISQNASPWIAAMLLNEEPIEIYWQCGEYLRRGLQTLDLTGNPLRYAARPLAQALHSNRSLKHLILSDCEIFPTECAILTEALLSNHHLQTLDLSKNPIAQGSDEGIQSIKTTLSKNHFLQELNLAETNLDSSAAIALAECLPENTTLTRLDLSRNPHITMAGLLALSISIKMNHTLTFLDINIPPNDMEMAELQNEIVSVCTRNMKLSYDQQVNQQPANDTATEESSVNVSSSSSTGTSSSSSALSLPQSQDENQPFSRIPKKNEDDAGRINYSSNSSNDTANMSISSSYALDEISLVDDIPL